MNEPGRTCPLDYGTSAAALDRPADLQADTLYIIGGLYGNTAALAAVERQAARERTDAGLPEPRLVFNGDFNWFNADPVAFLCINRKVLQHTAMQGNVEAELADPGPETDCGCAYPEWISDAVVARSNAIMGHLQEVARSAPGAATGLGRLPRQLVAEVADCRVGIVHGDPESLAGWRLAVENMPPPGETPPWLATWFRQARVDVFACSHTCLPFAQRFQVDGEPALVMNNGATGMPNFRGDRRGVVTRISRWPPPHGSLYGTRIGALYADAIAVDCVPEHWRAWFDATWPPGSAAAAAYGERLRDGPEHHLHDAARLDPASVAG